MPPCALSGRPGKAGAGKPKGLVFRGSEGEDGRRRLAAVEGGKDIARRIATVFFLKIGQRRPVMEDARATPDQPFAVASHVPGYSGAWTKHIGDGAVERVGVTNYEAVGSFFLQGLPGTIEEISERCAGAARIRVAVIVPADPVVQGNVVPDFPGVLSEESIGDTRSIPVVLRPLPGYRIIGETGFGVDIIARQLQQTVELERRLIIGAIEDFDIIAEEAFIPHPDVMRLDGVREDVAPVIVVLDEVALGEACSKARCQCW